MHLQFGISAEHLSLAESVAACARWADLVEHGLVTLHLPGEGGGVLDLAVALEAAGRALLPGPYLPTVLTSALLVRHGDQAGLLPQLSTGSPAAIALSPDLTAVRTDGGWRIDGVVEPVLGADEAAVLVLGASHGRSEVWFAAEPGSGVAVEPLPAVDQARGVARVRVDGLTVPDAEVLSGLSRERVRTLGAVLASAEAVGTAAWCLETAVDYVKIREQFGRPVGSFQAVKHKATNLFTRLQLATAAAWDAARAADEDAEDQLRLASATAAISCLPAAREIALECLTLLGGIGFTWEHKLHFYWRRALSLAQLFGPPHEWARTLGRDALAGGVRRFDIDLGPEVAGFRVGVAADLALAADLAEQEQRRFLADRGYVSPHYPKPYGMAASPAEQLVVREEFARAGLTQPSTIIGEFALPTIIAHGTDEQRDRFVAATLRGDLEWCQLFSEPGAGSDLASLTTRAVRVPGGWRISGQKVWNSKAESAHFGICLARTAAPKHQGITYFIVDMGEPGIEVRPIRQANGRSDFNEVFLDEVFVPDANVLGAEGQGWKLARTTLSHERVMIASGPAMTGLTTLLEEVRAEPVTDAWAERLGALTAENGALRALMLRSALRQLSGLEPGAASSVLKLAATEHQRAVTTTRLERLGAHGAVDGDLVTTYLSLPALLIGGGTREIQLNVVAERILGLPRASTEG